MKLFFTLIIFLFALCNTYATTFTSNVTSGIWSVPGTWVRSVITGTNTIPTSADDVVILTGATISMTTTAAGKTLLINSGAILKCGGKILYLEGDLTNLGSMSGNCTLYLAGANATFSSTTTYTCTGTIFVQKTCTIAAGTVINKLGQLTVQNPNVGVYNFGSVNLRNTGVSSNDGRLTLQTSSCFWINETGSSLGLATNAVLSGSNFFDCSAPSNTVTMNGTYNRPPRVTPPFFYDLRLNANTTKTLSTTLNVLNDLTLATSPTNILNTSGQNVNIGGNLIAGGVIVCAATNTITFNGLGNTQTVSGAQNTKFTNLKIDNAGGSVVFTTPKTVTRALIMTNGDCNSNGNLILASNSLSTAIITAITNTANVSFTGNMIIQKHLAGSSNSGDGFNQSYHDLSSPVKASTVNDWDNEMFISGIGPYDGIGGPAGVDGNVFNGFASMNTYVENTDIFMPVSGSGTGLIPGKGYDLLFCDSYDAITDVATWNGKTIDTRGVPNFGDVKIGGLTKTAAAGQGWNLVGNPYACPIILSNANMSISSGTLTNNIYFTEGANYVDYPRATTVIPPHQGFWIERGSGSSAAATLTFKESSKINNFTTKYYREAASYDIKLTISSNVTPYHHQNKINFNSDATVGFDEEVDAKYYKFPITVSPALYMIDKKNEVELIKNEINSSEDEVVIPLGIFTPKAGVYNIDASILSLDAYNYAWLENVKTGVKYDLNSAIAIEGEAQKTNKDYVLRLSKIKQNNSISQTIVESDLIIFSTENTVNLKSTNSDYDLKEVLIYDMTGKLVQIQTGVYVTAGNISKVDVTNLPTGVYIVKVTDEQGRTSTKKLIK